MPLPEQQAALILDTTPTVPEAGSLLTAEEVARLLQVTPAWVYAETRQNRIPHLRLGRYVRYRRSALESWMDEVERSSSSRRATRRR
jgi:excisionase family DNA binding protein